MKNLVGGLESLESLEFYDFPYIGNNQSQLTNSIIFQRGRYTTRYMMDNINICDGYMMDT